MFVYEYNSRYIIVYIILCMGWGTNEWTFDLYHVYIRNKLIVQTNSTNNDIAVAYS